ncbi:MAG: hypothetical protein KJ015_32850 [Myxococcales bacterium]|nr:hypothetical protein [Sorangiineae bacterium PRO1]MCL4754984.1 hypothetical protein [Myxococcales bacterium]
MHVPNASAEIDAYYAVGKLLYDNDDFCRAADVFRLVALLDPRRGDAWWALGACHEQEGELETAAAMYETGFHLGEQPIDIGLLAARALYRTGERARAQEIIELLKRERPATRDERLQSLEREMKEAGSCR